MEICLSRWYFMVSYSVVCLSKIPYLCFSSGILLKGGKSVWEDRKDYIRWANIDFVHQKKLIKMEKTVKLPP